MQACWSALQGQCLCHRLWRRYLLNNPRFVALVVLQALGVRRYGLE